MEALKQAAAQAAVAAELSSGMRVGLGTGSTVAYVLEALAEALRSGTLHDIIGVPTSEETAQRAQALGIPLAELHAVGELDVTIDGADEVDPRLDLIKGLGGALLREKMVAQATRRLVIVADETKQVQRLGQRAPLPVEVVPFGWQTHLPFLEAANARAVRREKAGQPVVTDNGNFILDCYFETDGHIEDPAIFEWLLLARAGIVEHGLFLDMAAVVYLAGAAGVQTLARPEGE